MYVFSSALIVLKLNVITFQFALNKLFLTETYRIPKTVFRPHTQCHSVPLASVSLPLGSVRGRGLFLGVSLVRLTYLLT